MEFIYQHKYYPDVKIYVPAKDYYEATRILDEITNWESDNWLESEAQYLNQKA